MDFQLEQSLQHSILQHRLFRACVPCMYYRTTQIIHRFRGCSICSFYSVSVLQIQYAVGQRGTSVVLSRQYASHDHIRPDR